MISNAIISAVAIMGSVIEIPPDGGCETAFPRSALPRNAPPNPLVSACPHPL